MANEKHSFALGVLGVLGLILVAFLALSFFHVGGEPAISIVPAMPIIGKRTPVKIDVAEPRRGLTRVEVELVQGDKSEVLTIKTYSPRSWLSLRGPQTARDTIFLEVGRESVPTLKPGTAIIRVVVDRAGTWLRHPGPTTQEVSLPVRLMPPSVQLTSTQVYVAQGGCEVVSYRVGESSVHDGVRSGSWWFPGYPLPGGGKQDRFAFFAVPYDNSEPKVKLVAVDGAGNESEVNIVDKFFPKPPHTDTIQVTDEFMSKVVPEILSQSPEIQERSSILDSYLAINSELRKKDGDVLKELAAKSTQEFLWHKAFEMMPNGKVMSAFADRRTYMYKDRVIDHQDHLGYDLAVTRQSPVPSSNDGVVALARYFGIFGNAVVVDHGYGIMSLYGHLSSISVNAGQKVARGDILGKTGETGLAGGDHLHFTVLLQGLPVNPVEWWDGHWIRDRIAKKLGPAFPFEE
ncbi:MAG TPA: M23 family metallopeptidase [Acidobacteriota bacterium]|nr:M23 family metallopeptidase [Acidobacteriota bacterium]